jgi:CTP:molybdopterin cytidylyltransferase MocA
MTVAAIVLVPDAAAALSDADGEPAVRRVAHAAWSGGALPVVIVTDDGEGKVADAVAGLQVHLSMPGPDEPRGVAWLVHGLRAASSAVAETTAGFLWPARCAWIDPETVTSMVEAHGSAAGKIIRPAWQGQQGFPILVPVGLIDALLTRIHLHGYEAVEEMIASGAPNLILELGDPGIVYDLETPRSELPEYQGPPRPEAAATLEWNAELAAAAEVSAEPDR